MNIQKLEALATRLENWDNETYGRFFDISLFIGKTECGTCCCIAGDVVLSEGLTPNKRTDVFTQARDILGLTTEQAWWLFGGNFTKTLPSRISPQLAAKAVRLLISEGSDAVGQTVD